MPESRINDTTVTFRLPRHLRERLQAYAAAGGRGESEMLREIIESALSTTPRPSLVITRHRSTRSTRSTRA